MWGGAGYWMDWAWDCGFYAWQVMGVAQAGAHTVFRVKAPRHTCDLVKK